LNVDFKIASACIANRIKPILRNIISETQKGFLKGRYIGECTRLIYDLIDKLEEDDIPGLLLLIDFEKAFDTVEWSFIEKTLQFYGFGPSLQKWIKAFYCDISSAVTNNGHVSEFFSLGRGVRQGDPLSPYLFILVLELLSAAIKNDFHDKCLSGRSCSWQLRLEPSHIASVLSKLTLSPAHSENLLKTLALPILVQSLTVLPNPPDSVLNDIEKIFYKFLWNGKKDKIKRSIIINEYEEGGLKMPNIQSFYRALKMSWLH
jgi:hypothetical protein